MLYRAVLYFSGAHDFLFFTGTDGISQAVLTAACQESHTDVYTHRNYCLELV